MNLNVHLHSLVLEGVFTRPSAAAAPVFHTLPPPSDHDIAQLLEQVHHRVLGLLRRRGRLPADPSPTDPVAEQLPLLAGYASASIQELVASGPRAGHPVRRLRSAAAIVDEQKPRCARLEGFSLQANVAVAPHARAQLEHLCRYLLRPPGARPVDRKFPRPAAVRASASPTGWLHPPLLLDPLELIENLSVLGPAPRLHLLRFHGVLAPHAAWRAQIIPHPTAAGSPAPEADVTQKGPGAVADSPPPACSSGLSWAALLKRVFAIDVLVCPRCGGRRHIVAVVTAGQRLRALLQRLGLGDPAAAPGPSRSPPRSDGSL